MKIHIELDPTSQLDRKALLAFVEIIGANTDTVEAELPIPSVAEETPVAVEKAEENPPVAEAAPVEEPTVVEAAPAEAQPVEAAPAEEKRTISKEEWTQIMLEKRISLGLLSPEGKSVGAAMASARTQFNDFVKEQSKAYGAELPKNLPPETLYKFVKEVFQHISYDPIQGFKVGEYDKELPF